MERGVAVVTAQDNRWLRCDLKTTSLLGNVLMRQLAADHDAVETVMFRDGHLTEASASNVLVVRDGVVIAPPKDNLILPGITYDATLEFARDAGVPLDVRAGHARRGAGRRRDVAFVVDEGSAGRDHASTASPFAGGAPGPAVPAGLDRVPAAQAGVIEPRRNPLPPAGARAAKPLGALRFPGQSSSGFVIPIAPVLEHETPARRPLDGARPRR